MNHTTIQNGKRGIRKGKGKSLQNKALIPLYLGITGHRDIMDKNWNDLKKLIIDVFVHKQNQCPDTPIILLTPLAEGADRIAAHAAIECKIEFIAILPMPVDEFKHDFLSSDSLKEFNDLLSKASKVIELPLQEGVTIKDLTNIDKRNEQYYQSGLFISRQCHTLIAFWDGIDNKKKGGTADIVRLKKSGIPMKFEQNSKKLNQLQTGLIYQIITPRLSNPVIDNPFTIKMLFPYRYGNDHVKAKKDDEETLKRIDSYNRVVSWRLPHLEKGAKISANNLFDGYPHLKQDLKLQSIAEKFAVAGELANSFQSKRYYALKGLLSLVVLAFLFLHSNAEFFHEPLILLLYPVTMGIGAIWFFIANAKKYEYKHEDYRALSEAFRIQFFLKAAGKNENVSDHYLKRHRGELEWVLYALRASLINDWESNDRPSVVKISHPMDILTFLKTNWIEDQLKYFKRMATQHDNSSKNWKFLANLSFLIAILSACLLFVISFYKGIFPENLKNFEANLHSTLSCCTSVFLVLAAALHGYSEKMIFAEQAKNYQQMAELFQLANEKLNHAIELKDPTEANDIISELAQEALLENGDWLLLHRSRPLEIPKG